MYVDILLCKCIKSLLLVAKHRYHHLHHHLESVLIYTYVQYLVIICIRFYKHVNCYYLLISLFYGYTEYTKIKFRKFRYNNVYKVKSFFFSRACFEQFA